MTVQNRNEIDPKYTWDLTNIFQSDEVFLDTLKAAQAYPTTLMRYQGTLANPKQMLSFLQLNDQISITFGKLINYAERKSDEDTRVALYQDYSAQVMNLYVTVATASSWFTPELLSLAPSQIEDMYTQEPELELYRLSLDRILREREHTLSAPEEELIAKTLDMAQQPGNIYSLFNDADLTFPRATDSMGNVHEVTHGSYVPLLMQPDRELRESAFHSLYSVYGQFRNTAASMMGAQLKQQQFYADVRKYESTLAYSLDSNEVPTSVYTNLIDTVHENLPALHHYVDLRKQLLGLDELHYWDLYVPMVEDFDMSTTYEEACDIILQALKPMGSDYLAIVQEALNNRWIDVYENPGKRSGAYSAGSYGMHPVMLLNFQGELDDVFTLIHEMGHSVHTYLSCKNQPACYSDYVIFVAEVASTCNEALLTHYLLEHAQNNKERAYILNHYLEQFRATLYRQAMFAEFELKINELNAQGAGITADLLCELYGQLNKDYHGESIEFDEEIALEWARIPHFYYNYYVYQYATGFAAAVALSRRIITEGEPAVQDYLGFLSGGCSKTPIELLKDAGVDMTTPDPIQQALSEFAQLVDELEELIKQL